MNNIGKIDKNFYLNILNTVVPNYIDNLTIKLIKEKQRFRKNDTDAFIELSDEFRNIFDSSFYQLGPSRFMSLLRKKT